MSEVRRRRVPAMSPDDRRAALVEATIPLLYEHGVDVSTRQIAAAAGVAEGTIFGVFPDKTSLIVAALARALDVRPTLDALDAIDESLGLRDRLVEATRLIHDRFSRNANLMNAARTLVFSSGDHQEAAGQMMKSRELLQAAIAMVITPDATQLRRSPESAARLLLLFVGANAFGPFGEPGEFRPAETVSLLLDGLLVVSHHGGER